MMYGLYRLYLMLVVARYSVATTASSNNDHILVCDKNVESERPVGIDQAEDSMRSVGQQQDNSDEWHRAYHDEYNEDYQVKIIEKSLDTRVADTLYSKNKLNFYYLNYQKFNYGDSSIRREYESFINGPEVDQRLCTKYLLQMNALLSELELINRYQRNTSSEKDISSMPKLSERHILLARVLDSYGRYESGVLVGRAELVGSSEQCLETKLKLGPGPDDQVVKTRYCKVAFEFNTDLDPRIKDKSALSINVGICLPDTCHSNSLGDNKHLIKRLVDSQFSMPESIYVNKHREIESLYCTNDNNTSIGLPFGGRLFVAVAIIWTMVIIGATYYADDLRLMRSKFIGTIAKCFDMRVLVRNFLRYDQSLKVNGSDRPPVNLNALNIVKVVCMACAMGAHLLHTLVNSGPNPLSESFAFRKDSIATTALSMHLAVDTFFVMSALLFTYLSLKKYKAAIESSKTLVQISRRASELFLYRYLKLVPLYFIVFWFKKSVLLYLGSGPLWDHGFNQNSMFGGCKEQSWLTPLTPLSTYVPFPKQCLPQTWSLGSEIYFLLITVPALILLVKKAKLFMYISFSIGFMSSLLMYGALLNIDPADLRSINLLSNNMSNLLMSKYSLIYMNPSYRLVSVSSGMIGGYVLYYYELDSRKWPTWFTNRATKIAITAVAIAVGWHTMIPLVIKFDLPSKFLRYDLFKQYFVTLRAVWNLAICAIVLRLITDCQDAPIVRLFNGRLGCMMSKINLAAMLIHMDLIFSRYVFRRGIRAEFSIMRFVDIFLLIYVYTIILSALVHVFIESPIDNLVKYLLRGQSQGTAPSKKKKQS